MTRSENITDILRLSRDGNEEAFRLLTNLLYKDLRRLAHKQREVAHDVVTLNTTGLVHEAYLRLVGRDGIRWRDRQHFISVAVRAMRFILIDQARERLSAKRGEGWVRSPLTDSRLPGSDRARGIVELGMALEKLAKLDPRLVQVVECRYFAGLTADETAEILDVSKRTVQRDCLRARGWLRAELLEFET
jgi:RNA polymerase sigma factor (TIGR02999 family)